jgi:hypothetical protein
MSNPPPKRKWAPKSKGGCSTCKSRRVKCDERQPRCTPCQKSSRQCQQPSYRNSNPLRVVLWQPNELGLSRLSQNPSHTSDEIRAFEFFRTKVAIKLSGFFVSRFWTIDVLQVGQQEDPISHAIVALASLSEAMMNTESQSTKLLLESFAIRQHTKAISDLRKMMQENNPSSPEILLMACALFICFEMFRGHYESALTHMSSGIYVSFNWNSQNCKGNFEGGMITSNNSSALPIRLQRIFARLMLQTILFVQTKPLEWKFIRPTFTPALPLIPSGFTSVDEARDCLDNCMCALYHRILTSQFLSLSNIASQTSTNHSRSDMASNPLEEWSLSFQSFMIQQQRNLSTTELNAAELLKI